MATSVRITMLALVVMSLWSAGCESQRRFSTPEDAASALANATEARDREALRRLFGPRVAELRSGDEEQDATDFASFSRSLAAGREVERGESGGATLLIGEERWPFAVPLVNEEGGWRFDTDAGIEELTNRRIGRNELRTIAACRTLIDAQVQYRAVDRDGDQVLEFAQRVMSTSGTRDGLYWPAPGGVDPSPIGPVMAFAAVRTDEGGQRLPFNGYYYRLLTAQGSGAPGGAMSYLSGADLTGGWAVIAWPAEYGETGVMSFLAGHGGVVYEQDLGPDSESAAAAIAEFDPSAGWTRVSP